MISARTVASSIAALLVCAALQLAACAGEGVGALVRQLGDPSFQKRETALWALVKTGKRALPELRKAAKSRDPEIQWRAMAAARMIGWHVSPALAARIGPAFVAYSRKNWHERERLVMDIAAVGGKAALATLGRVLAVDDARPVKRAAAMGLLRMGPEGLLEIEKHGGKLLGLPPGSASLRVQIGNGFLEEGKHARALKEYRKAIKLAPRHKIAWYNVACAHSLMKQVRKAVDALGKAIDFGYDDVEWMEKDSDLDNIRSDKQYQKLVEMLEKRAAQRKGEGKRED